MNRCLVCTQEAHVLKPARFQVGADGIFPSIDSLRVLDDPQLLAVV